MKNPDIATLEFIKRDMQTRIDDLNGEAIVAEDRGEVNKAFAKRNQATSLLRYKMGTLQTMIDHFNQVNTRN